MGRGAGIALSVLVMSTLAAPLACGGGGAATTTAPPPAAAAAPAFDAGVAPPSHGAGPTQAGPLATVFTTDPNALASLLASAAAAAPAFLAPPAANADPAEAGLRAAAAQHA